MRRLGFQRQGIYFPTYFGPLLQLNGSTGDRDLKTADGSFYYTGNWGFRVAECIFEIILPVTSTYDGPQKAEMNSSLRFYVNSNVNS